MTVARLVRRRFKAMNWNNPNGRGDNRMNNRFKGYVAEITKLESVLRNLSKAQLSFRIAENKWNITEILAHLVDAEIQVYTRFRSILADDVPFLVNHNQEKWTTIFKHGEMDAVECLSTFKFVRGLNYRLIESLDEAQLEMEGLHSTRGRMTVANLIKGHIVHLRNHLDQIDKNLVEFQRIKV